MPKEGGNERMYGFMGEDGKAREVQPRGVKKNEAMELPAITEEMLKAHEERDAARLNQATRQQLEALPKAPG